ncbi:peptide methionine sulfoxide reductase msrA/msrB [Granulicatella balaenopterae]|uniref:Peptide methionine sulfoxide reductase MsrA n=1 Tax=Granulicatella balaenopterae TaxID=137733 RepID=A0A1H9LKJ4_9LACT|nr:peptide-methionine (S)-S-oxide reductase MsrA [Granulicatella balaenopterae]SER11936.1 peptide methionine sulfoxide reductase msrA/msrB [Granulicatella balaenopterae]
MTEVKKIYLAAGCFWGSQAYFKRIDGIKQVVAGYANGQTEHTNYQRVAETDHAEAVEVSYDSTQINLTSILAHYFRMIDPLSLNKQGGDTGRQYRTGIYYTEQQQEKITKAYMEAEQTKYTKPIQVELDPLKNFIIAEEYHQDYLAKHPQGYCHINLSLADEKINLPEINIVK